jgi:hypothetical protein
MESLLPRPGPASPALEALELKGYPAAAPDWHRAPACSASLAALKSLRGRRQQTRAEDPQHRADTEDEL